MRLFSCSTCKSMVFFENVCCTNCGHELGFLPGALVMSSFEPSSEDPRVRIALASEGKGQRFRKCRNGTEYDVCNWFVADDDPNPFCIACRLNDVIPNLDDPDAKTAWARIEVAKHRLLYTLLRLRLPIEPRAESPDRGLAFSFMKDTQNVHVMTGHADGLITINVLEADDPERERMRKDMGEAYRTLLGHFRHEVGHYYFQRLVQNSSRVGPFRELFGDERSSYQDALQRHYRDGAPTDWPTRFVSAYASMHPHEDWAESWAHYLHMVDTLETARSYGMSLRPKPVGAGPEPKVDTRAVDAEDWDALIENWIPVTLALNSLNRSMGLPDPYPFVLGEAAITKLHFVHDTIAELTRTGHEREARPAAS